MIERAIVTMSTKDLTQSLKELQDDVDRFKQAHKVVSGWKL